MWDVFASWGIDEAWALSVPGTNEQLDIDFQWVQARASGSELDPCFYLNQHVAK